VVTDGRSQVLRDGQEVAAGVVQGVQRLDHLLVRLAHAEDEVRLRDQSGRAGGREDRQRPVVAEAGSDLLEDPGHGLQVVTEDLRS
jgi:hypothetical protein